VWPTKSTTRWGDARFLRFAGAQEGPGSQEHEDLKIIERQGLHCKQVVENLLSFSRMGRETSTDTDLNACLQDTIKVVRHSLEMKTSICLSNWLKTCPGSRATTVNCSKCF
jgi:signal transduction histidine kinase